MNGCSQLLKYPGSSEHQLQNTRCEENLGSRLARIHSARPCGTSAPLRVSLAAVTRASPARPSASLLLLLQLHLDLLGSSDCLVCWPKTADLWKTVWRCREDLFVQQSFGCAKLQGLEGHQKIGSVWPFS